MSAVYDSKYIEPLTNAGLTEQQAEAIALVADNIANGAVQETKEKIAKLEERIDKLEASTKSDLLKLGKSLKVFMDNTLLENCGPAVSSAAL